MSLASLQPKDRAGRQQSSRTDSSSVPAVSRWAAAAGERREIIGELFDSSAFELDR